MPKTCDSRSIVSGGSAAGGAFFQRKNVVREVRPRSAICCDAVELPFVGNAEERGETGARDPSRVAGSGGCRYRRAEDHVHSLVPFGTFLQDLR